MDRETVLERWQAALESETHDGGYCPLCETVVRLAAAGGYIPASYWLTLIRLYFLPGTPIATARDWLLQGCPPGRIDAHGGWEPSRAADPNAETLLNLPMETTGKGGAA